MQYIGRHQEIKDLQEHYLRAMPTLIAVYGRRRVGKTALVENAYSNYFLLKFEGLEGSNISKQKEHFYETLLSYGYDGCPIIPHKASWKQLLILLAEFVREKKCAIFFDEFQWMASERRSLVSQLKFVWDNYFSKNDGVTIVICGSVSSFIVKKVIQSKALYGRIHLEINLQPLTYRELTSSLKDYQSNEQLLELFLIFGGIPEYLQRVDLQSSIPNILSSLFLSSNRYFYNELDKIFVSHFGRNPVYKQIVMLLSKQKNLSKLEIEKGVRLSSGGRISEYLEDLAISGLVEKYTSLLSKNNRVRYRIKDNFLRFYFNFFGNIEINSLIPSKNASLDSILPQARYSIWKALAFEYFCQGHHEVISEELGFSAVKYRCGSWFKGGKPGAQIDLLFERADKIATLVEVKWQSRPVGVKIIDEVKKKTEVLRESHSINTEAVLITVGPVTKDLVEQKFFRKILCLEDLS